MILIFTRIDKEAFEKSPSLPIDIAVMEKTDKGLVLPLDAGWSDMEVGKLFGKLQTKIKKEISFKEK